MSTLFRFAVLSAFVFTDTGMVLSAKGASADAKSGEKMSYNPMLVILLAELAKLIVAKIILAAGWFQYSGRDGPLNVKNNSARAPLPVEEEEMKDPLENTEHVATLSSSTTKKSHLKLLSDSDTGSSVNPQMWTYLRYSVPSLFYAVQNNLNLVAVAYCGVAVFTLFNSSKILFSALINKLLLKQSFHFDQKLGMTLVTGALVISRLDSVLNSTSATSPADDGLFLLGVALVLFTSFLSGLCGGINEFLLKKVDATVAPMQKNVWLYQWGAMFNAGALLAQQGRSIASRDSSTTHLQTTTGLQLGSLGPAQMLLVALMASFGITVSLTLQYFDNVMRAVTAVIPVFAGSILAAFLFGDENAEKVSFWVAAGLCAAGTLFYQRGTVRLKEMASQSVGVE